MSDAFWMGLFTLLALIAKEWFLDRSRINEIKKDINTIEKATNSMKDSLVEATGERRFLEGKAEERTNPEIPPHKKPWTGE